MKHLGDISKINGADIEPVDIITFGSPCQDLSVAGKRAGLDGARSGLFMEAVRIIREMREATDGKYPKLCLWENVPGAFSSNKGEDFRVVLEELIKIAEPSAAMPEVPPFGWAYADSYVGDGWSLAYRVFDTQYWPRTPQRRRRIYLVADFGGQRAREILFEREGLRGHLTESPPPRERVTAYVEVGSGAADSEGGKLNTVSILNPWDSQGNHVVDGTGSYNFLTLRGCGGAGYQAGYVLACSVGADGVKGIDAVGLDVYNMAVTGRVTKTLNAVASDADHVPCVMEPGINAEAITVHGEKISGTLLSRDYKGAGRWDSLDKVVCCPNEEDPIALDRAFYNQGQNAQYSPQYYTDGTVPTLVAKGPAAVCAKYIIRRLTPTECARLQGFPDTWGHPDKKDSLSDEEYGFWLEVRNTHASINGKAVKEYTKDQMLKWYNKLHSDSAEYKMWGNGIALPPSLYCMQGIEKALEKEINEEEKDNGKLDFQ